MMIDRAATRQQAEFAPLLKQNEALRAQADDNRRQIETPRSCSVRPWRATKARSFRPEEEVQKLNDERVNLLAEPSPTKSSRSCPAGKTPDEMARMQQAQTERIATQLTDNLRPLLGDFSANRRTRPPNSRTATMPASRR